MSKSIDPAMGHDELDSDEPRPSRWSKVKPVIRRAAVEAAWFGIRVLVWRYIGPDVGGLLPPRNDTF